jgi:hypothetical protein
MIAALIFLSAEVQQLHYFSAMAAALPKGL